MSEPINMIRKIGVEQPIVPDAVERALTAGGLGTADLVQSLHEQLRVVRAERAALAERLRGSPELREIVADLRQIKLALKRGQYDWSQDHVESLVRRLDVEPVSAAADRIADDLGRAMKRL